MARQPRIDYPGAVHHVMNRGADHQVVFRDDRDRIIFLELWSQAVAKFEIVVVSYSLLGNHFHFLVETPSAQLSQSLQFVLKRYTQRFNARHGRDGALFRGRFHSVVVDSDPYFERVGRYIELNPVAAGIVPLAQLDRYRWSSFQFYAGRAIAPAWLRTDRMLERYQHPEQYVRFVKSDLGDRALRDFYRSEFRPGVVLGNEDFALAIRDTNPSLGRLKAGIAAISLREIDRVVSSLSLCEPSDLATYRPEDSDIPRRVAVDLAYRLTNATAKVVADRYNFPTANAATQAIRRSRNSPMPELQQLRTSTLKALGRGPDGHPKQPSYPNQT